jgi:protein SCO1/2
VAVILAGLAVAGVVRHRRAPSEPLPQLGPVPVVRLVDQRGTAWSTAELRGRVTIVNFIFTRCPTICPVTSLKMKRLAERTRATPGVELLSISVDPEHDTPPVLTAFAARYGADPARWRFATGDPAPLRAAIEDGFKIAVEQRGELPDGVPDIVHGGHFVLVDRAGVMRGYYDSDDAARLDALAADATGLASGALR